jgi:hypothetical protein
MTVDQMTQALESVGACFAVSSAKFVSPNDPHGSKPAYHIHPDVSCPHEKNIVRVYSQKQLQDWVRTAKAVERADDEQGYYLWQAYSDRWSEQGAIIL